MTDTPPPRLIDWQSQEWTPDCGRKAAHANARFTVSAQQCPIIDQEWQNPQGVPISAIVFGGRRATTVPLVYQAEDWRHGVYLAATTSSETTAAAAGALGVLRHDPMAMLPFCGYNMGDYFQHWLDLGAKLAQPPQIFRANWFRKNSEGHYLWPGFSDNLRPLMWILERISQRAKAQETPIGLMPRYEDLNWQGINNFSEGQFDELMAIRKEEWSKEVQQHIKFFNQFGPHLPVVFKQIAARLCEDFQCEAEASTLTSS